jgi:hypothetical protein
MTRDLAWLVLVAAALSLSPLAQGAPAPATLRVDTPGSAFHRTLGAARLDDVADGRRVRGEEHAEVTLVGELRLPSSSLAEPRAARLVLHFRTSRYGPKLRTLVLPDGGVIDLAAEGNQMGDTRVNTIDFGSAPLNLSGHTTVKLVIGFPGGIDSHVDPGEFVLKSVSVDVLRKAAPHALGAREQPLVSPSLQPTHAKLEASLDTAESHSIFEKPAMDIGAGVSRRLDWCRTWSDECGKPAADAFCASKGYRRSRQFEAEKGVGETVVISSGQWCSGSGCTAFARIVCE